MEYTYHEGTQAEKPKEIDVNSSLTVVYLRRNIERITREDPISGDTIELWGYEEAEISYDEYERILTQRIDKVTPYTITKNAYIDDTEVTFTDVPAGNMTVYVKDSEDNYLDYTIDRTGRTVTICFGPLENVTTITLSILKED